MNKKWARRRIFLLFQILLLSGNISICQGAWVIQELDSLPDVGRINSLAVDRNANVHVVYLNPDTSAGSLLKHAFTNNGSGWTIETITKAWGDLGIATDGTNNIHVISLGEKDQWNLRYTISDGNGNVQSAASNSGSWIYNHSIALNNQIPMISANQYCTNTGGCFAGDNTYTSHLYYITISGGVFQFEKIDGGEPGVSGSGEFGKSNSIASDQAGNPHIVYDVIMGSARDIAYARRGNNGWEKYWIDNSTQSLKGIYIKNAVDLNGKVHVAYYDMTSNQLKYAVGNDNVWSKEVVDNTVGIGEYLSLAIDNNNRPCISYYDKTNMLLKYAFKDTSDVWQFEIVDQSVSVEIGKYTSIAIDNNNQPIITYYDSGKRIVKIAYRNDLDSDGDGIPNRFDTYPTNADSNGNSIQDGIDSNIPIRIDRISSSGDGGDGGGGSVSMNATSSFWGCSMVPEGRVGSRGGDATGITIGFCLVVLYYNRKRVGKRSVNK